MNFAEHEQKLRLYFLIFAGTYRFFDKFSACFLYL